MLCATRYLVTGSIADREADGTDHHRHACGGPAAPTVGMSRVRPPRHYHRCMAPAELPLLTIDGNRFDDLDGFAREFNTL